MNAASGTDGAAAAEREQRIREAFAAAGATPRIHQVKPGDLPRCLDIIAEGTDIVVAAGGDGTVSAIAGSLAGGAVPLGVLPLGTLNHFARDLGMPQELAAAAAVIVARHTKQIDVCEVNGRLFVNNSSIGLYPEAVLHREQQQKATGRSKWVAMGIAAARVLRRFRMLQARVKFPDRAMACATPLIFVGNNVYTVNFKQLGERAHLDGGVLSVYLVRSRGRLQMFWMMVRAILGRLDAVSDFEAVTATDVVVTIGSRHVQVAIDGEVTPMQSPLHYRIHPAALTVIVPATPEAPAAAADPEPGRDTPP